MLKNLIAKIKGFLGLKGGLTSIRAQLVRSAQANGLLDETTPKILENTLERLVFFSIFFILIKNHRNFSSVKETLHCEVANNPGFIEIMEEIWSLMKEILKEVENQIPSRGITKI